MITLWRVLRLARHAFKTIRTHDQSSTDPRLSKKFSQHLRNKRVICLAIPDKYDYMEPALVRLLEVKVAPYLR